MEEVLLLSEEDDAGIISEFASVGRIKTWQRNLSVVLARAFECIACKRGTTEVGFVGFEPDVIVVKYLFHVLRKDLQRGSAKHFKLRQNSLISAWKFEQSFCMAAVDAVEERLQEKRRSKSNSAERSLAVTKIQFVKNHLHGMKNYTGPSRSPKTIATDLGAAHLGASFGQEVCLDDRPLPDKTPNQPVLHLENKEL